VTSSLTDVAHGTRAFIDANIFVYHFSADSRLNWACTGSLLPLNKASWSAAPQRQWFKKRPTE
jgi:hypothetical protein